MSRRRDLTTAEALREARRRLGSKAAVTLGPPVTAKNIQAAFERIVARQHELEERRELGNAALVAAGKSPHPALLSLDCRIEVELRLWASRANNRARVGVIELGLFFMERASAPTFREAFDKLDADAQQLASRKTAGVR